MVFDFFTKLGTICDLPIGIFKYIKYINELY